MTESLEPRIINGWRVYDSPVTPLKNGEKPLTSPDELSQMTLASLMRHQYTIEDINPHKEQERLEGRIKEGYQEALKMLTSNLHDTKEEYADAYLVVGDLDRATKHSLYVGQNAEGVAGIRELSGNPDNTYYRRLDGILLIPFSIVPCEPRENTNTNYM